MRITHIVSWTIALLFSIVAISCSTKANQEQAQKQEEMINHDKDAFDAELAAQLGADDYGMKQYVMAFLMQGPNRDLPEDKAAELQRAHLDNIGRLAEAGKLLLAGPFLDNEDMRGIYIFDVRTVSFPKSCPFESRVIL